MAKITQQLINDVSNRYNQTSKTTGAVRKLLSIMRENVGKDLKESVSSALKEIRSAAVLENIGTVCDSLAKVFRQEKRYQVSNDFSAIAEDAKAEAATRPPTVEDLKFPTPDQWDAFDASLTGPDKALARLIWFGGFKVEDLARDKHKLTRTQEGVVEVRGGIGTTKARTVTSEDSFGLSQEDYKEVLPLLQDKFFSNEALGLQCLDSIGSITNGWEFTPTQIRVGHAERLLEEGFSYAEVAEIQGINQETLRQRQRKYRRAVAN